MTAAPKLNRLPSWIPPSFAWTTATDVFAIKVPIDDPGLVAFVASGEHWVTLHRTKKQAQLTALLLDTHGFTGQMELAAWTALRHSEDWKKQFASAKLHCHGVFCIGGGSELLVLVAVAPPARPGHWLSETVGIKARELLAEHQAKLVEFEAHIESKKQENERIFGSSEEMAKAKSLGETLLAVESFHQRPVLTPGLLLPHLSSAETFSTPRSLNPQRVERDAIAAISESKWPASREGTYVGLLSIPLGSERISMVTWAPYAGPPAYPEVRWAVQRRLPNALLKPRLHRPSRPEIGSGAKPQDETLVVLGADADGTDPVGALDDLQLDDTDFQRRVEEVRDEVKTQGFEAIAWFQPYHSWTEETWGIYFDAHKLDALALSFLDDLRTQRVGASQTIAAQLAFGLTYAHELFHARVEAALSWMEINALQPRHLRYARRVYGALRETPEWLEEALANWSAWEWFRSEAGKAVFAGSVTSLDGLQRVVDAALDLSPPGYREWRIGHLPATWRTFATQLSTGNPNLPSVGIGLPLESTLKGPLPYDFRPADIPLRFVGRGVIADRLQSQPATFNVPTRREIEKALKHYAHSLDASGGKGGHQKWTGPDQRAFILPTRDPVSTGVFKTFLHHLGIDKATYVREVRPNL